MFEDNVKPQIAITDGMVSKRPELEKLKPKVLTPEEKQIEIIHKKDIDKSKIFVPDIFFWVTYDFYEKPDMMTASFKWKNQLFGESWKVDPEWSKSVRRAYEKKLMAKMVETLGLLVHMGDLILDRNGDIDPVKANDEIARRYFLDKMWKARIEAFHKVIRVKAINVVKARELGLL